MSKKQKKPPRLDQASRLDLSIALAKADAADKNLQDRYSLNVYKRLKDVDLRTEVMAKRLGHIAGKPDQPGLWIGFISPFLTGATISGLLTAFYFIGEAL